MSRKKRSTPPEKPAVILDSDIEALAKQLHDESEQIQARLFNTKKQPNGYVVMQWEDMKEGFYKDNVRKVIRKRLEDGEVQPKVHRRRTRKI